MHRWVEISFDCLPLGTIGRVDIPLDASPRYRQFCEAVKAAMEQHGSHNAFYVYNARCNFHVTNDPLRGSIEFKFRGTILTNSDDSETRQCDLEVELAGETCDWLTAPILEWFEQSVPRAVAVEFDRYIQSTDLAAAKARVEQIEAASDEADGFVGMYL